MVMELRHDLTDNYTLTLANTVELEYFLENRLEIYYTYKNQNIPGVRRIIDEVISICRELYRLIKVKVQIIVRLGRPNELHESDRRALVYIDNCIRDKVLQFESLRVFKIAHEPRIHNDYKNKFHWDRVIIREFLISSHSRGLC